MTEVRALVTYCSGPPPNRRMAARLARVAEQAGAEVRLRHVGEFSLGVDLNGAWADVAWADVVLWGTPSRYGNVANQLSDIFERLGPRWVTRHLSQKVFAGFTTSHLEDEQLGPAELEAFDRMAERSVAFVQRRRAA